MSCQGMLFIGSLVLACLLVGHQTLTFPISDGGYTYNNSQICDGLQIPGGGYTLDTCYQLCVSNSSCDAVDYNHVDRWCYFHPGIVNNGSCHFLFRNATNVTHKRKFSCDIQTTLSPETTTTAVNGTTVILETTTTPDIQTTLGPETTTTRGLIETTQNPTTSPGPTLFPPKSMIPPKLIIPLMGYGDITPGNDGLSQACAQAYSAVFTVNSQTMTSNVNALLAQGSLCSVGAYLGLIWIDANVRAVLLDITTIHVSLELPGHNELTNAAITVCGNAILSYMGDLNNWPQPILPDVQSCPTISINPFQLVDDGMAWCTQDQS